MITVVGTNDSPTANPEVDTIDVGGLNPVSGNLLVNDSDPDVGDSLTVASVDGNTDPLVDAVGSFGTLDWNADGSYSYQLDTANPTVAALAPTDTLTETFTYVIDDGNGGTDTTTLSITITASASQ